VNFGPLTAEIGSGVWGTPYKFQRVLRLGSITARHLVTVYYMFQNFNCSVHGCADSSLIGVLSFVVASLRLPA